ncbi:hypothetical protein KC326_g16 [Hortaea werneckii]|nr:hypothetical protein KC326_g16 [Hortaea werneckii]
MIDPLPRTLHHAQRAQLGQSALEQRHTLLLVRIVAHNGLESLPEVASVDEVAGLQVELVEHRGRRLPVAVEIVVGRCQRALDCVAWARGEDFTVRGAEVVDEDFVEGEFFRVDESSGEKVLEGVCEAAEERGEVLVLLREGGLVHAELDFLSVDRGSQGGIPDVFFAPQRFASLCLFPQQFIQISRDVCALGQPMSFDIQAEDGFQDLNGGIGRHFPYLLTSARRMRSEEFAVKSGSH